MVVGEAPISAFLVPECVHCRDLGEVGLRPVSTDLIMLYPEQMLLGSMLFGAIGRSDPFRILLRIELAIWTQGYHI